MNVTKQNQRFDPIPPLDQRWLSFVDYPALGHTEATVVRVTNMRHHERKAESRHAQDPEAQRVAIARARSVVARKCRAIAASRMLTLTTRECITDLESFWRLFSRFLQRCRRAGIEFRYVAVPEQQRRGAWHLHVAIDRYLPHADIYREWIAVVGSGTSDFHAFKARSDVDKAIAVSGYISKYIGKNLMGAEFGRKRYRASRGIELQKETILMDRRFTSDLVSLGQLFEQETGLFARSIRINDYGGAWVASWGDTLDENGS